MMTRPEIILIAAITRNNVIGSCGGMPWKISSDLKRFKSLTTGNPVVMGYRTFQSIGRLLPGRTNIIITRDNTRRASVNPEAVLASSILDSLDLASKTGSKKIFIIGGGEIYAQTISLAHTLYITHIEKEIEGDVFFPSIDSNIWKKQEKEIITSAGEGDDYPTRFVIYDRFLSKNCS
ncbi:Dihydrofolate reductase type 3 [Candidatus Liberibacter asiaticus]|nr:Dihydrofolate reductase type 3 [Candidatus Liberibacter asiaticus]KAE9512011.1 Dihydrofolate reductase type 3 [Candidatus Liberibacter asiaticus]KAE9513070.1 Dihydrofolate reductase type 3 [Candidatus Liberibacter asiaticus]KAE9519418.1 Dihydrofolate reductase type 3 [Candidatus Liberibacter asiaticus]KAE9520446.1 Dihydrofolate reductase type 3 [Candidatus Liberibacter asiaticus]